MGDRDPKMRVAPKESSIPPERVSHTTIAIPEEAASSSRAVQLSDVPALWLDRLLIATTALPFDAGEEAVTRALVDAVATILDRCAVGACLVPSDAQRQVVVRRVPPGDDARVAGSDPTRIFPGYTHERIFEIAGPIGGSTLHVAADDPRLEDERFPPVHLARRAAVALDAALAHARARAGVAAKQRELASLEAHVIQADKLASFGQIAAGMVHELNNPLTSIVAYSDYLIKKALVKNGADADDMERLQRISESANRMLRFTRDLVSYARPSGERPTPVVLHAVIDQAVAFCEHVLNESSATVERRYGADVLTVRGLAEQLAQVFVNLITNACHAMPQAGGRITITTELEAEQPNGARFVRVYVEDNGHGIAAENLPHVFAPFFTTKRDGRGTGLGLSIVRSIVDNHDGEIAVASDPPRGTRFTLRLPSGR